MHSPQAGIYHAQGGRATSRAERAERLLPSKLRPVAEALERALQTVETDELYTRQATAMATVAVALMRIYTVSELEERMRVVEARAEQWQQRDRAAFESGHWGTGA